MTDYVPLWEQGRCTPAGAAAGALAIRIRRNREKSARVVRKGIAAHTRDCRRDPAVRARIARSHEGAKPCTS